MGKLCFPWCPLPDFQMFLMSTFSDFNMVLPCKVNILYLKSQHSVRQWVNSEKSLGVSRWDWALLEDCSLVEVCGPNNDEMCETCFDECVIFLCQFSLFMQSGQKNHSCNYLALKRITNCWFELLGIADENKINKHQTGWNHDFVSCFLVWKRTIKTEIM